MQPYEVISLLEGTSSKTEKEAIVASAYKAGCLEFFLGAQLAYSKMVTFGTKDVPFFKDITTTTDTLRWNDFNILADMLRTRQVTGGDATTAMIVTAEHCNEQMWDGWYRRILLKDFRCGITEGTVNKALKSIVKAGDKDAEKYMVPVFTCQLAHPRDKYEKLMTGDKFVDIKLDGARILALCDKDKGTVTLCTRNGLIKENFTEIEELLRTQLLPKLTRSAVLDGEMVSKTFKALMSQLNRQTDVDTSDAKFAVFDFVWMDDFEKGVSKVTQTERDKAVAWACRTINDDRIYHIEKRIINLDTPEGLAELDEFHARVTAAGFEGTMVKDPDAHHVTKRSPAWLKI